MPLPDDEHWVLSYYRTSEINGALFFGRPETVADKIIALHDLMQVDRFEMHVSHVDHAKTMRSIELFATEVAPLVQERLATPSH